MNFKVNDLVILSEKGIESYWKTQVRVEDVFCVLSTYESGLGMYGYKLNDREKYRFYLRTNNFRIATELDVKKYKIKNLFYKRDKNAL
jgi:hypothetical protein